MDKIRESEIEYTMFLDSWQDITAPSGNEIHLNGYIEGCKSRDEEIKKLRDALEEMCNILEPYLEADAGQERQYTALIIAWDLIKDSE